MAVARVNKKLLGLHGLAGSPEKGLDVVRVESAVVVVTDDAYLVTVDSLADDCAISDPVNVKAELCRTLIKDSESDPVLLESAPGITVGKEARFPDWRRFMKKFPHGGGLYVDARRLERILKFIINLYPREDRVSTAPVWICLPKTQSEPIAIRGLTTSKGWRARALLMPLDEKEVLRRPW